MLTVDTRSKRLKIAHRDEVYTTQPLTDTTSSYERWQKRLQLVIRWRKSDNANGNGSNQPLQLFHNNNSTTNGSSITHMDSYGRYRTSHKWSLNQWQSVIIMISGTLVTKQKPLRIGWMHGTTLTETSNATESIWYVITVLRLSEDSY